VKAVWALASVTMPPSPQAFEYHWPHSWSLMIRFVTALPVSIM